MRSIALFLLSACIAGSALAQATPKKPAMLMPGTGKIQIGLGGRGDYKRAEKGAPANAPAAIDYYNGANPDMMPPGNVQADPSAAAATAQAKSTPAAPQLHSDSKLPGDGDKARVIQAQKEKAAQAKVLADAYAKAQAAALAKAKTTATPTSGTSGNVGAPASY